MMRDINIFLLCVVCVASSCSSPASVTPAPPIPASGKVSIAYLKSLYSGYPRTITEDYVVSGSVVSSDMSRNFHKALVVQDSTGGIEVKVDWDSLFEIFPQGTVVEIACNGLTLGAYGGLAQLGGAPSGEYEAGYISEEDIAGRITSLGMGEQPIPALVSIPGLSPAHLSRYVGLDMVQFADEEQGGSWCGGDGGSVRTLTDRDGNRLSVWTSPRALFASYGLPPGSGYIAGILSWFNGEYQLKVVDLIDVAMDGERF